MKKIASIVMLSLILLFTAAQVSGQQNKSQRAHRKKHQTTYRYNKSAPKEVTGRNARMQMQLKQGAAHQRQDKRVQKVQKEVKKEQRLHN